VAEGWRVWESNLHKERLELGDDSVPGWRVHKFLDRMFFGKSYSKIHQNMDAAVIVLGRRHRILFHNELWAYAFAEEYYPNDFNAVYAGNLHLLVDQLCSNDPGFKKMLENMEMLERRKKNKKKGARAKKAQKIDPYFAKILNDLKKFEEAKKMLSFFQSH
jgi:hypothetical protein